MNANKLRLLIAIVLAPLALAPSASGQVIVDTDTRSRTIAGLDAILNNASKDVFVPISRSPFILQQEIATPQPVQMEAAVVAETATDAAPLPSVRLADDAALMVIAQEFRPVGSLVRGDHGVLRFSDGRSIAKGESFRARIHEFSYEVTVLEVSSAGYVLGLGSARVARGFQSAAGESTRSGISLPSASPQP